MTPVLFLGSNQWFRPLLIGTDVWKEFGYNSVVYLAALTSIDTGLYEAASIDGANHGFQKPYGCCKTELHIQKTCSVYISINNIAGFIYNRIV